MTIAYTNNYYTLLQNIQTLLQVEFATLPVLIGDRTSIKQATIILEPNSKDPNTAMTYGKKSPEYSVSIWIYKQLTNDEESVNSLASIAENIEQLLINNVKYPVGDGSQWLQCKLEKVDYGFVQKTGDFLRIARMTTLFKQVQNR